MKGERNEEIREKISPPFDPAVVCAGGLCPLHRKRWVPSPFVPFGCLSHRFLKVIKNESVGMGEGVLVSQPPPFFHEGTCLTS